MVSATLPAETPSETEFSAEAWFRTTAQGGMLVEIYSGSPVGADRSLYVKDGKACFYVYGAKLSSVCSTAAVNDGQWHHVLTTRASRERPRMP